MSPQASSATAPQTFPLFKLPPPMMFGIAFALGAALQHLLPMAGLPFAAAAFDVGAALLAIGVCCGAGLAISFLARRTTLNPFGDPSHLVVRGPYRLSRNPMYLTLVIAYLGGTLMLGSAWPLLTLLGPVAVLSRVVIPVEEAHMLATFGDAYRDYCGRVRRWL